MTTQAALLALAAAALGTYAARSGLILLLADRHLPVTVERALRNVGPAVLAALAINLAVGQDGIGSVEFAEVGSLVAAAGVALWRRNLIWTLVAAMVVIWILSPIT